MAVIHVVATHVPNRGASAAVFALIGALGGSLVTGVLGWFGLGRQARNENARQQAQFEHNLSEHDRDVLRATAGDAAEALGQCRASLVRLARVSIGPTGEKAALRREDGALQHRLASTASRASFERLRLQLPPDDDLMCAYEAALLTVDRITKVLQEHPLDFENNLKQEGAQLDADMEAFALAARTEVGRRI